MSDAVASPRLSLAFGLALASAVALSLPGFALNQVEDHAPPQDHFVPAVATIQGALPLLPLLAAALTAAWVWRARSQVRVLSPGRRAGYLVGLAVFQLAVSAGLGVALILSRSHWLFGLPVPYARRASPDGQRTAYAAMDCFLGCTLQISVQEGHSPWMHEVQRLPGVRHDPLPTIVWSADSAQVTAVGAESEPPLPSWGPH